MDQISSSAEYICPNCSQAVQVTSAGEHAQLWSCPHCGEGFVVAGADGSTELPKESPHAELDAADSDEELNNVRIRRLMETRVAANRRRAFAQFGAAACVVGAIAATVRMIGQPISQWTFVYVALVAILVGLASVLLRRARVFATEAQEAKLPEPTSPPDFSTLGDGSQRWKDLENLR